MAIIFDRFGPYHAARLNAAAQRTSVVAIEVAGQSVEYAWTRLDGAEDFERYTLFPNAVSGQLSLRDLRGGFCALLDHIRPDVVAIPGWSDRGAIVALSWCLRNRTPTILMSESTVLDAQRHAPMEFLKARILRLVGAGLVGGQRSAQYVAGLGLPLERIFVGYDIVDNDYFAKGAGIAQSRCKEIRQVLGLPDRYFLASARFISKKNLSFLLQAFQRYRSLQRDHAWRLVILGDGPLREQLHREREALGLNDEVMFPGFIQYDLLPSYYGLASAFVHASLVEQWGLVVNEALASGLPVLVSSRCGCAPDLVENGCNGYTFDPTDVEQLADLMVRLSEGGDLQSMQESSRNIVSRWSPQTFADGILRAARAAIDVGPAETSFLSDLLLRAVART